MKKRICSLLLICSMLAGLLPQIVLPQAAAADTAAARDGFGLPTEEKTGITDKATLRNNPYGTLGWVPLFQNHELVVAGVDSDEFQTTYEGAANGKGGQMSTFRWSNSTDVGNAERIATVAFDPNGTGKDEYIANLVFDKSSERLRLYVTNKDRRVSEVVQIGDDDDSRYIKNLKFYQTRAMLSLAAGDFDGDGKDTLMIYTPGNNKNTYTVDSIKEYTFSGSTLTDKGRVINLGDVIDGGQEALKAMLCHDGNGDNELRAHLSVDMEVGDVDMDGIDELAMTVNVNDLKESEYKLDGKTYTDFEKSYLTVYDYNNSNKWSQMTKQTLLNSSGGARGRARFAGVTIGYVSDAPSGSMPPEVVAVGYYDKKDNYRDCEFDTSKLLAYSYQYSTKDNSWIEKIKATEVVTNGFTNTGTKGDDVQNPIAVAAVAADGVNSQEYLFISGSMYKVGTVNGSQQLSILDGSDKGHDRWLGGRLINNSGILDYAIGNFDGNKQGMEQVYYVEYRKQETFDKQFLKIGQLYKGSAGSTFSRWEDDWTYYDKGNCNLAIATADVNNDAMLAKIKSVSTGYTDPKVMAILEASPHFAEVNDGDIGNSQTGIGYSKDHSVTRGSKVVFTATPAVENGRNKQMVAQWTVNGVDRNNISNELVIPSLTGKTDVAVKFVPYEGFAIPTGGTGWKVSDVKRVPNDTQPTSKIRKNGELTFTVGLASDYTVISKLVINGYDCINGKLAKNATLHGCDAVEARKNANGSYTVTIKNVTAVPDMSVEAHRVIIGSLTVPEKFKNIPELDTVEKIQAKLTAELTGRKDGVAFYDIALKYYDGSEWIPVNENNFPAEGVDVVLPYPNGTDSKDTFQIVHMLTKTGSEGEIEKVDHTKEIDGLRFHVTRLSPFGVSWTKYTAPTPGGGGGGGAVAPTTYDIVIPSALANTVKADKTKAAAGDTVTLTDAGEGTLTVTDANGKTVALTDLGSGKYTFKMPSAKVSVGFKTIADQPCDGGKDCPSAPFTDVDTAKWYHLSVDYVLAHNMMNGVSSRAFAPNANLTRGMLVQILYNLEGKPKGTAANFSDVQADAWYAEAVGWAASDKVVTGYADGTFRPNAAVTREQTAAILYRYAQSKGIDVSVGENTNILSYVDVQQASEYAIPALQWAVGAGVLNGKNGGRLAPTGTATRAEIAAIMQRWCENIIK